MADDSNTTEDTSASPPGAAGSGVPAGAEEAAPPRRRAAWPAVLALAVLGLVVGLETAGLLLRDHIEKRQPPLAAAPALIGEPEQEPGTLQAGSRFGPGVKEVPVAASFEPASPAPATPSPVTEPETPIEAPDTQPPPLPGPRAPAPPLPEPQAPPSPAPGPAAAGPKVAGTHALQVGLFGSQKYRHAMEQQLEDAGFPHFRQLKQKKGVGFRLAVPLAGEHEQVQARKAMDAAGYVYRIEGASLEAIFHFEEEAQRALRQLAEVGLKGGYGRVEGEMPLWVVYAGPFSEAEARSVRQKLAILGLPSYLRPLP